jgi:hypothetical protein
VPPREFFTSKEFARRVKKHKEKRVNEPEPNPKLDSDEPDHLDQEPHEKEQDPSIAKQQRKEKEIADKLRHIRKVNSKVSLRYDSSSTSKLAYEKIRLEQLQDPECKAIRDVLTLHDEGQGPETPLSKTASAKRDKIRSHYFIHEDLLMRRFVPLEGTDTPEDAQIAQQSDTATAPENVTQPECPSELATNDKEQLEEAKAPSETADPEQPSEAEVHSDESRLHTKTSSKRRVARRHRALNRFGPKGRIVVPKALIRDVLNVFHGIPLTGHLGKDKTVQTIGQYFY